MIENKRRYNCEIINTVKIECENNTGKEKINFFDL